MPQEFCPCVSASVDAAGRAWIPAVAPFGLSHRLSPRSPSFAASSKAK